MATVYYPSCKFTAYSPASSQKIQSYLAEKFSVQMLGCCRPEHKNRVQEDTVVYICNTCAAFAQETSRAEKIISVWEVMAEDEEFPLPDYGGQKMTLQDCWRVYDNPCQQKAVRKILRRMKIDIVELEENYDQTRFCGLGLYNPMPDEYKEFAPARFMEKGKGFFQPHTKEEQLGLMQKH